MKSIHCNNGGIELKWAIDNLFYFQRSLLNGMTCEEVIERGYVTVDGTVVEDPNMWLKRFGQHLIKVINEEFEIMVV